MEKNQQEALLHLRSNASCIAAGYRFYISHFKAVLRASWPVAVCYALIAGFIGVIYTDYVPKAVLAMMTMNPVLMGEAGSSWLMLIAGCLFFILASAILDSYSFSSCREYQATGNVLRPKKWYGRLDTKVLRRMATILCVSFLLFLLIAFAGCAAAYLCSQLFSPTVAAVATGLLLLIALLALIPFVYPFIKYIMCDGMPFKELFTKGYRVGLRHLGAIFIVVLVALIITQLLMMLTELPALILYAANFMSQMGVLQGDPLGMPHYMTWMSFTVYTLMGFIQAYVCLSACFPLIFLWGSIEKHEQERSEQDKLPINN